jgi:streptogramin lyase
VRFVKRSVGICLVLIFAGLNATPPTVSAAPGDHGLAASGRTPTISVPAYITAGPDGALWFTNLGNRTNHGSIGRITTSGKVTIYAGGGIDGPGGITVGLDRALWFTNTAGNWRHLAGSSSPTTCHLSPSACSWCRLLAIPPCGSRITTGHVISSTTS